VGEYLLPPDCGKKMYSTEKEAIVAFRRKGAIAKSRLQHIVRVAHTKVPRIIVYGGFISEDIRNEYNPLGVVLLDSSSEEDILDVLNTQESHDQDSVEDPLHEPMYQ
jgi:hypothetical protein